MLLSIYLESFLLPNSVYYPPLAPLLYAFNISTVTSFPPVTSLFLEHFIGSFNLFLSWRLLNFYYLICFLYFQCLYYPPPHLIPLTSQVFHQPLLPTDLVSCFFFLYDSFPFLITLFSIFSICFSIYYTLFFFFHMSFSTSPLVSFHIC